MSKALNKTVNPTQVVVASAMEAVGIQGTFLSHFVCRSDTHTGLKHTINQLDMFMTEAWTCAKHCTS